MKSRLMSWIATLIVGGACAGAEPHVKPAGMSAAEHRENAKTERALAEQDEARWDPAATRIAPIVAPAGSESATIVFPVAVYNPTDRYLRNADQHRDHAREHERAASALEHFEEGSCVQFPGRTRAACPLLGPVTKIDDVSGGVRITFAPGARVDAIVEHMRCHYAYARAHGFDRGVSCPLYMPGLTIRPAGEQRIELLVSVPAHVEELRARSREEAVYTKRGP